MHTPRQYEVHYRLRGEPNTLMMTSFAIPALERVRLQVLLRHIEQPQVLVDAPWEDPVHNSLESRVEELGVSDIEVLPAGEKA